MKITYVIGSGDFRIKYADSSNYRGYEYAFSNTYSREQDLFFDYDKRAYLIYEH